MSNVELVLNMLAEVATKEISKKENPQYFEESKEIAQKGGSVAGNARKELEQKTGQQVVTPENNRENRIKKIKFRGQERDKNE